LPNQVIQPERCASLLHCAGSRRRWRSPRRWILCCPGCRSPGSHPGERWRGLRSSVET